jgi:hypothetical protein
VVAGGDVLDEGGNKGIANYCRDTSGLCNSQKDGRVNQSKHSKHTN